MCCLLLCMLTGVAYTPTLRQAVTASCCSSAAATRRAARASWQRRLILRLVCMPSCAAGTAADAWWCSLGQRQQLERHWQMQQLLRSLCGTVRFISEAALIKAVWGLCSVCFTKLHASESEVCMALGGHTACTHVDLSGKVLHHRACLLLLSKWAVLSRRTEARGCNVTHRLRVACRQYSGMHTTGRHVCCGSSRG